VAAEPWEGRLEAAGGDADGRDWVAEAQRNWSLIRKICRQKQPMGAVVGGLLSDAAPIRYEPGMPVTLVIQAKFDFHLNKLRDHDKREVVEWALEQALGVPFRAHFVTTNEPQRGMTPARQQAGGGASATPSASVAQATTPRSQVYERGATNANGANGANGVPGSDMRASAARSTSAPASGAPLSARSNGHRAAAPQGAQGNKTPPAGQAELRERPAEPIAPSAQLEQAAREDPVVQEFARMLKAEVADVRALEAQDADES
jgi:hypothetical protein